MLLIAVCCGVPHCRHDRYSVDGEEIEIKGLAEPFVLELELDEATCLLRAHPSFLCPGHF